jgi:rubrerythrin
MKKAFQELAEMEEEHRKKLEGFDLKNVGEIGLEEVKGLGIAEMMEDIPFSSEMSYADLIRVAIKQEERSEHLYLSTEKLVKEPKLKRLLLFLAQEETGHKLRLEKIYDEEILKEF